MPIERTSDLVNLLRQLRLLTDADLDDIKRRPYANARQLANDLIKRQLLTPYQANLIFHDRGRELLLGPYLLLERLGEGGMGTVYKARHVQMQRVVALKIMRQDRLASPKAVRRFQQEITAAAQLVHPNIVVAFDTGQADGRHYFSMEYVDGVNLDQLVKKQGPLPVRFACLCIRQAALGLQHAHECGLIHRDIKPHNLLLQRSAGSGAGAVKILDMGLARLAGPLSGDSQTDALTQDGAILGTPDYIAPEQARQASNVDIRADLYSLGCVFYYLLAGRAPFADCSMTEKLLKHQMEEPPPLEKLRPDVPAAVSAIVRKLLAKRPEDRHQSPQQLVDALTAELAGGRSSARLPQAGPVAAGTAGSRVLAASGRAARFLAFTPWGRRLLAGGAGLLGLLLLINWISSAGSQSQTGLPLDAAAFQYVKGKTRGETIAATLNSNGLPLLDGNLHVIGPFDYAGRADLDTPYPPETEIDLAKSYPGKDGQLVAWKEHPAMPIYAAQRLDFLKFYVDKGTGGGCFYVYHPLTTRADCSLSISCTGPASRIKAWLNGAPLPVASQSFVLDLKAGQNDLLVKVAFDRSISSLNWRPSLSSPLEAPLGFRLELDFPLGLVYDGETLKILAKSRDFPAAPEDMRDVAGSLWRGNSHLQVRSSQPGDWIDFHIPQGRPNTRIVVYLTKAPEHGIVQFFLDGIPLGDRIDLYQPGPPVNTGPIQLGGNRQLKMGAVLRAQVVGANDRAEGIRHGWGFDCIVFQ